MLGVRGEYWQQFARESLCVCIFTFVCVLFIFYFWGELFSLRITVCCLFFCL